MPGLENIANNIHLWLNETFNATFAMLIEFVIVGVCIIGLFAMLGLVLIMMERKVSAWMQLRLGPNRVGPVGMFQTVADTLKLMVKEGMTPNSADKFLFNLAPFIVMIIAMVVMAPLMFAKGLQIWDINIGILFVTAISSVSVIGILMAGWASNNKYSLLGAMRSGAQIVSYELSAGFAILSIVILTGDLKISEIVNSQANGWWIFKGHLPVFIAFVIFIVASTAEINRAPFDLSEA
ncbi:MAG TPA: complex I subunit 1 family protein, partial [Chitinophagaceae bacterium]|nr:complex I subunit 1 family protein [Chitinophagaceae bacterium]